MNTFNTPGSTPLDPDERKELIPNYITDRNHLNILEQINITKGMQWLALQKKPDALDISFIYELHKQMFQQVWKWAGKQRVTDKNIGCHWQQISTQLDLLLKNTKYWIENKTYDWDELATRYHHKLVSIHVFTNGNGRHARLITDVLLKSNKQKTFTWGRKISSDQVENEGNTRNMYLSALRQADKDDFADLMKFVRS